MNTKTWYLGLELGHPFIAGASPLSAHLDTVKRLEDAGAAAIVMHSLFEEQITFATTGRIHHRDPLDPQFAAALAPFPAPEEYPFEPAQYLEHVRRVAAAVRIPVIASLNGTSPEPWLLYAREFKSAGASAVELNCYHIVTDAHVPSTTVEDQILHVVTEMRRALQLPVAVKLSPYFSAFANFASRLDAAGADGLVLFNRFYQPDIDFRTMTPVPTLELSRSNDLLLRLRWLAILFGRVRASLALTGGVETVHDGVKGLLAGADAVQTVSAVLRHGPEFLTRLRTALEKWMEAQHFNSIAELRGKVSLLSSPDAEAFERANYIRTLQLWNK